MYTGLNVCRRIWKVWDLVSAPLSDLENVLQQYVPQYNLSSEPNSLQKFNSFLKYLRTSPGFQLKLTFWLSDEVSQITQSKSSFLNDFIIIYDTRCLENSWHLFDDVL